MWRSHWTPFRESCGCDLDRNPLGFLASERISCETEEPIYTDYIIFWAEGRFALCSVFCVLYVLVTSQSKLEKKLRIFIFSQSSILRSRMQCPKLFLRKYINNVAFTVLLTWRLANELRHKVTFLMKWRQLTCHFPLWLELKETPYKYSIGEGYNVYSVHSQEQYNQLDFPLDKSPSWNGYITNFRMKMNRRYHYSARLGISGQWKWFYYLWNFYRD